MMLTVMFLAYNYIKKLECLELDTLVVVDYNYINNYVVI